MNTSPKSVNIFESFKVAMKRINENAEGTFSDYIFEGICADFSERNRNGREYDKDEYLGFVNGTLAEQIAQKSLAGGLDHPEDDEDEEKDIFTPKMRELSHIILALWYEEATQQVKIRIKLLDTHLGKDAKACADAGMPIFISSRASGIIDKNNNVHLDNIHTFDIVYKPGFKQAKLARVFESSENNSSFINIFESTKTAETKPSQEQIDKLKSENMETVSKKEFDGAIEKINESLIILSKTLKSKNKFKVNESKFTKRLKRLKVNEEESLDKQDIVALIVDATDAPIEDVAKSVTDETVEKINAILNDENVFDKVIDIVEQDMGEMVNEAEETQKSETYEESKKFLTSLLASFNRISEDEAVKGVTDEMIANYEAKKTEDNSSMNASQVNESLVKRFNKSFRKVYESKEMTDMINLMNEADLKEYNQALKSVSDSGTEKTIVIPVCGNQRNFKLTKNTEDNTVEVTELGDDYIDGSKLIDTVACDTIKRINEEFKSKYIKESEEVENAENFIATSDAPASDKVSVIQNFNDLYGADNDIVEGDDEETVESFLQAQNQLTIESVAQKVDLANKSGLNKINIVSKRVNSIVEYMNTISETFNVLNAQVERQNAIIAAMSEQLAVTQTRLNNIVEYSNIIANSVNATGQMQVEQTNTINESVKTSKKRKQVFESIDEKIDKIISNAVRGNIKSTGKNGVELSEIPQKYSSVFEGLTTKAQNEVLAFVAFKNPKSNLELESIWESLNLEKGGSTAIFESTNFAYDDEFISKMIG